MIRRTDVFAGITAIFIAVFFFGIDSIFSKKLLLIGWNAIIITFIIRVFKTIFIGIFAKLKKTNLSWRHTRGVRLKLVALGCVGAGGYLSFVWALNHSRIADANFIRQTMPIWVIIFSYLFLKEKITPPKIVSLILTLFGLYLINNEAGWSSISLGFMLALVSAILHSFDVILGRSLRNYPYEAVSFYTQVFGMVLLLPLTLLTFEVPSSYLVKDIAFLMIPAAILGGAASMLYYFSLRQLEAIWVGLITPLQVVIASIFAFLIFREMPSSVAIVGGCLIIIAVCNLVLFSNRGYIRMTDIRNFWDRLKASVSP